MCIVSFCENISLLKRPVERVVATAVAGHTPGALVPGCLPANPQTGSLNTRGNWLIPLLPPPCSIDWEHMGGVRGSLRPFVVCRACMRDVSLVVMPQNMCCVFAMFAPRTPACVLVPCWVLKPHLPVCVCSRVASSLPSLGGGDTH